MATTTIVITMKTMALVGMRTNQQSTNDETTTMATMNRMAETTTTAMKAT
jgi:hypothetical protein